MWADRSIASPPHLPCPIGSGSPFKGQIRLSGLQQQPGDPDNSIPGNYAYDATGRLIADASDGRTMAYTHTGMLARVKQSGQPLATFTYDERDLRLSKTLHDAQGTPIAITHYLRDAMGQLLETRTQDLATSTTSTDLVISGLGRIGFLTQNAHELRYELTDHLGNQRAQLKRANDGSPELISATDYYPFGMEMPGRGTTATDLTVAYAYQGAFAEKERALNWSLFDLRSYDGRLGRFHNPDPIWEYASPYMAMGNNPLSVVDPTGGWGQGGGQQSIYCPECGDTEPPAQTGTGGGTSSGTNGSTGNGWGGTGSMNATEFDYWNRFTNGDDNALNHDDGPNYDPDYVNQGSPFDDGRYIEGRKMQGTTGNATQSVNGPCPKCLEELAAKMRRFDSDFQNYGVKLFSSRTMVFATSIAVEFTPQAIAFDLYTIGTGRDYITDEEVEWYWAAGGLIPGVSGTRKLKAAQKISNVGKFLDEF